MPKCAYMFGQRSHFETLCARTKYLLNKVGKRHRKEVAHLLTAGLPTRFKTSTLGMSKRQAKEAAEEHEVEPSKSIGAACYAENVEREKVTEGMTHMFRTFFMDSTHQCSGADNSKARIMDKELFAWEGQLHAAWPGLLRALSKSHPELLPSMDDIPKKGWSDFDACLLSAVHTETPDPEAERKERYDEFLRTYVAQLARTRGCLPPATKKEKAAAAAVRAARTKSRMTKEVFVPAEYTIKAPSLEMFRTWLESEGLRFTRFSVPHPCPLCTQGPVNEAVFVNLSTQAAEMKTANEPIPLELSQRLTKLRTDIRIYRIHLRQLEAARSEAKKAEDGLVPGECMVIRDFVNHHDHSGKHVKCLHWVMMWRGKADEPIKRLKLRHYCSDPASMNTDSYYQADVTDFHFNEDNEHCPQLFKEFDTIIFVGDHGPHFASHATLYNESTLLRRFGKKIKIMFLASYHAYSRADASGAEDSTGLRRDLRSGLPRFGAASMTDMTNSSHDPFSWAYHFPAMNRNINVFPLGNYFKAKDRAKWIKKWCEIQFHHGHEHEAEQSDGILQYRLVTGQGPWQWTDLVAAKRSDEERMCDRCSTKAQAFVQHAQALCPDPGYIHDLPTYKDLQPDPGRIHGPQVAGKKKGAAKKGNTYPCKYPNCVHHTQARRAYRSATAANRHMQIEHKPTDAEWEQIQYNDDGAGQVQAVPKAKKAKKAKKSGKRAGNGGDQNDNNDITTDSSSSSSEEYGNQLSDDAEEDSEKDPDEMLDQGEDQYVVRALLRHKLLRNGKTNYLVAWEGTDTETWEPEGNLNRQLRSQYHEQAQINADKRAQAAAQSKDDGHGARRTGRLHISRAAAAEKDLKRKAYVAAQTTLNVSKGMSYFKAAEAADESANLKE
jgi:hypothetical protein